MQKYLIITNSNELVRVSTNRVVYINSDGNYSTLVLTNGDEKVFSFNLAAFQKLIEQQLQSDAQIFIRIGKSLIINRTYIHYINISKQQLVLSDKSFNQSFTLSASKEALKQLKTVLETMNDDVLMMNFLDRIDKVALHDKEIKKIKIYRKAFYHTKCIYRSQSFYQK